MNFLCKAPGFEIVNNKNTFLYSCVGSSSELSELPSSPPPWPQAKVLLLTPEWAQSLPLSREDVDWIEANGGERITHTVALDYQHYSMQAILHAALPPAVREVPSAFEVVGHIAHLNLKENVLPYKEMVGRSEELRVDSGRGMFAWL